MGVFSAANGQGYNQTNSSAKDTLYVDTTLYYARPVVPLDSVKAWKSSKGFAYVKDMDSLLKAAKQNEQRKEASTAPSEAGWLAKLLTSDGVKFFFWTLAIAFVLFVLYKLFLTEGAFRRNTLASNPATPEVVEEVITSESDLDLLIKQALQSGNYRLAVRYKYLQTLYRLAAKKMVELAADKTNYQYVRELANQNDQNDFAALTLNYEYVWYGEFEIDQNIYRRIDNSFSQFNSKLQ